MKKSYEEYLSIRKFLMGDNDTKVEVNPFAENEK